MRVRLCENVRPEQSPAVKMFTIKRKTEWGIDGGLARVILSELDDEAAAFVVEG